MPSICTEKLRGLIFQGYKFSNVEDKQFTNITTMKTDFDQLENDRMIDDPMNYKWGIFYFNRKDSRTVLPKRIRGMGWTLNFGNIYTYVLIILMVTTIIYISKIYS